MKEARAEAENYRTTFDKEMTALIEELDAQQKVADGKAKIAELEAIVKSTKETDTLTKRNRYEELLALNPQNKEYKQKFAHYQKQLAAEERRRSRRFVATVRTT